MSVDYSLYSYLFKNLKISLTHLNNQNHERCYDGEQVPDQDDGIVPAFITKLFSPTDEPEEKPRRNIFLDLFTPPDM